MATGISCGIDSLYTIQQYSITNLPESRRINTLAFFNVGSSMKGEVLHTSLVEGRYQLAKKFAQEYNFAFWRLIITHRAILIINSH